MRLYYFTSQRHGLAAIRDRRLKIALYSELNDPFDFVGIATKNPQERVELKTIRNRLSKTSGILCMSRNWRNPLLWGHYADKHKGMCLGFDVNPADWEKVDYIDDRPTLMDYAIQSITQLSDRHIKNLSLKKFRNWEYEDEYRRTIPLPSKDFVEEIHFLKFDERLTLKEVMFGERTTVKDEQITKILEYDNELKFSFTRAAYQSFKVVHRESQRTKWAYTGRVIELTTPEILLFNIDEERDA